jgi:hypothetical protein
MFGPDRKQVTRVGELESQRKSQENEHDNYQTKQDEMGRSGSTYRLFVTRASQPKICDFSGETYKGFEVL